MPNANDPLPAVSLHSLAADIFAPMLENLSAILDKGAEHAQSTGLDLVNARLAPDMYPLAKQVQLASYYARDVMARLSGQSAAPVGEPGANLAQMKAQISEALQAVRSTDASAFEGADRADCTIHVSDTMVIALDTRHYLFAWTLPSFYFHLVTAYDILRHHGVPLGKQDYISQISAFVRTK